MTIPPPTADPNPFRAPSARVADASPSTTAGQLLDEPRRVSAGAPAQWLSTGWAMFKEAPGPWVGMVVVYMLISLGVGMIPVIGLLGTLLGPILVAGLTMAADGQSRGQRPELGNLFDGFKRNAGSLAMVGVLYLCVFLGFALLAGVGLVGMFGAAMAGGGGDGMGAMAIGGGLVFGALLVLLIGPLSFSTMWAPALVALHDIPALQALKMSLSAGLRNWVALLVVMLWGFVLLIPVLLTFGLAGLVVGPVAIIALWAAYRDIFVR